MDPSKHLYKGMEGLIVLALEQLVPPKTVWWNPPQAAVPFDSDILIGRRPFSPETVFLVTHSGPQNGGQVKFWRDLHELFLYRSARPTTRVVRILFGQANSRLWQKKAEGIFDATVELDTLPGGTDVTRMLSAWTRQRFAAMDPGAVKTVLADLIHEAPLDTFLPVLVEHIGALLQRPVRAPLAEPPAPGTIETPYYPTAVRRAVTLLGIFPALLDMGRPSKTSCPPALLEAGVLEVGLTGPRPAEPWVCWIDSARSLLGTPLLADLARRAAPPLALIRRRWDHLKIYIDAVRSADRRPDDLAGFLDPHGTDTVGGIPLLLGLRYLLKSRAADGFGHGQLLAEAGLPVDTASLYRVSRMFRGEAPLEPRLLEPLRRRISTAAALARGDDLMPRLFSVLFNDEAVKVRQVEPLLWITQAAGPKDTRLHSAFSTMVDPSGKTGTLRLLRARDAVAHWKTAHKGQRDKTKELAAKGFALRSLHPEIRRAHLFLDGDWSPKNLQILASSGWTRVVPLSSMGELLHEYPLTRGLLWE